MDEKNRCGLRVWIAFIKTNARIMGQLSQEMQAEFDVPLTWYDVLMALSLSPQKALTMQDLAKAIIFSPSGLTRLVDRMNKKGLVERRACNHDRRVNYAVITEKGETLLAEISPAHHQGVQAHFLQHLTEEELEVLEGAFNKILAANNLP